MIPKGTSTTNNGSDQMGVELGKVLAKAILAQLGAPGDVTGHDSSVRISVFHLDPFLDAKTFRDRRPVLSITTRRTGRSRQVYDCVRRNV